MLRDLRENQWFVGIATSLIASFLFIIGAWLLQENATVPFWLFAVVCIFLIGVVSILVQRRSFSVSRKRVFVIVSAYVSAFQEQQFFADILQYLISDLAVHNLEVVPKTPSRDYSAYQQDQQFREILSNRHTYLGGILIPVEPKEREREIKEFVAQFRKPVVFLDVLPFASESEYPPNTCAVATDNKLGGKKAAEEMARILQGRSIVTPKVLVIGSSIQKDRQQGFMERIRVLLPTSILVLNEQGHFLRDEARRITLNEFRTANEGTIPFHGVFCTNDEMALGVLDALATLHTQSPTAVTVVGFDGIRQALLDIEQEDSALANTVVQNVKELTGRAVTSLIKLLAREQVQRITLLPPHLYKEPPSSQPQ
jgi:DNA-binding LacI/PurR family transcriptional regulator